MWLGNDGGGKCVLKISCPKSSSYCFFCCFLFGYTILALVDSSTLSNANKHADDYSRIPITEGETTTFGTQRS